MKKWRENEGLSSPFLHLPCFSVVVIDVSIPLLFSENDALLLFTPDKSDKDLFRKKNTRTAKEASMPFLFPTASSSSSPEEVWTIAFNQLSQRIRDSFVRPESHKRALAYAQGLMSKASRKNGWQVSEEVGEATPYAMQHLLNRAKWDCDCVRDELRAYVSEIFASPNGVLAIDETGFLKKRHAPRGAPFRMKTDSMGYTVKERSQ